MQLLLDTHTFLWYSTDNPALSVMARQAITDQGNQPHLSVASLWEIAIKVQLGKLRLRDPFETFISRVYAQQRLRVLSIQPSHLSRLTRLPLHHRDPFDRMVIGQALADDMTVVGCDAVMDAYGVKRIW